MQITLTPQEMQALERSWMQRSAVPGILLMEHAAQGVTAAITRHCPAKSSVLFLCGPGNNGGDGFAAARLWQAAGGRALVWALSEQSSGDSAVNRCLAVQAGASVQTLRSLPDALPPVDAVVDALFGTGLTRTVEGLAAGLIRLVNGSGKPVIAVDIPSGLNGATGQPMGCAVRAAETVTFHRPKQGLLLGPAAEYTGQLSVQPILIPLSEGPQDGLRCLEAEDVERLLPPRSPAVHKGCFGRVLIFAGAPGMAGAAAYCARAAVKCGAGLTTILCRASLLPLLQTLVPAAMCIPLPEDTDGHLLPAATDIARAAMDRADLPLSAPGSERTPICCRFSLCSPAGQSQ